MTDKRLFVHVGYAKAGSTFLQQRVFRSLKDIHYLGKARDHYPDWLIGWHYWDDLHFERRRAELRAQVDDLCLADRPNLISSEVFTMHGGHAAAQARRLKAIAPHARVILVVRDPVDRLLSFYRHLVQHDGLQLPLAECLDWKRAPSVFYKRKAVYLADYLYDELIALYRRLFGDCVCVLRFEHMIDEPESFFGSLSDFLGVRLDASALRHELRYKENPSIAVEALNGARFDNAVRALGRFIPDIQTDFARYRRLVEDDPEILPVGLRERLEQYFAGKCQGYY